MQIGKLSRAKITGLAVVFIWFFLGGIGHFTSTEFFVSIVPPWVPWPLTAVYVSGVFELLGAFGLLHARTRRVAGIGLFLLTLAVTPANVHMWLHPELFPNVSPVALSVRLIIQVALLWCIWWSTQPAAPSATDRSPAN
jgi:uncharacterized membrane protein